MGCNSSPYFSWLPQDCQKVVQLCEDIGFRTRWSQVPVAEPVVAVANVKIGNEMHVAWNCLSSSMSMCLVIHSFVCI